MELIPFIIGGFILWLYLRGRKKLNNNAPYCDRCKTKMEVPYSNSAYRRQQNPTDIGTQYGRTLWKYRCPSCGYERIQ